MPEDMVLTHLNLIARMLEAAGYVVDVDCSATLIIVWIDEWPIVVEVKTRSRAAGADVLAPAAS